jgi:hypothetical protein
MTKQEFEHRFEHAKFSLNNVQNNIRFIDRKVAGGMGLIAIALGFFISRSLVAKQLVLLHEENFKFLIWLEWIFLVLAAVALIVTLIYAAKTLFPRQTKDPRFINKNWVLFPMATKNEEVVILREEIAKRLSDTLTDEQILEEYADQLATTGHIQTLKMTACKSMFRSVWAFCSFVFILGVLSLWSYVSSQMNIRQEVSETKVSESASSM